MAFLDRILAKVSVGRKGPRGYRRMPSRKQARRLGVELIGAADDAFAQHDRHWNQ